MSFHVEDSCFDYTELSFNNYMIFPLNSAPPAPLRTPYTLISLLTLSLLRLLDSKLSRKSRMGLGIPPLTIKIMLESNPLKSIMLVGRFGRVID